jgi:hypothetical protein
MAKRIISLPLQPGLDDHRGVSADGPALFCCGPLDLSAGVLAWHRIPTSKVFRHLPIYVVT